MKRIELKALKHLKKLKTIHVLQGIMLLLVVLVPVVVQKRIVVLSSLEKMMLGVQPVYYDLFIVVKVLVFNIGFVLLMIVLLLALLKKEVKIRFRYEYVFIFLMLFLAFISTITGDYKSVFTNDYGYLYPNINEMASNARVEWNGLYSRYEGFYSWVSYLLIFCVTMLVFKTIKQRFLMAYAFIFGAAIVAIVGLFQIIGLDPLTSTLFRPILMTRQLFNEGELIAFSDDSRSISSTLFNANNLSQYLAMMLPVSIALFYMQNKRWKSMIIGSLSLLIFIVILYSKGSMSIYTSLFICFIWFIINIKAKYNIKRTLILTFLLIISYIIVNQVSDNHINDELFEKNIDDMTSENVKGAGRFDFEAKTVDKGVILRFDDIEILISKNIKDFMVTGVDGEPLIYETQESTHYLLGEFEGLSYKEYRDGRLLEFSYRGVYLPLYYYYDRYYVLGSNSMYYEIDYDVEWINLPVSLSFGTNRGYIWSRTFPLINDRVITGYGADTFPFVFPQYDYEGKYEFYGKTNIIVDKPHNQYLGIWFSFGLMYLVLFLVLISSIIIMNIMNLNNYHSFGKANKTLQMGLLFSLIAYLMTSIAYDSMVVTSLVFWFVLGNLANKVEY